MTTTDLVTPIDPRSSLYMRGLANHLGGYIFHKGEGVKGVELFGSIARGEGVTLGSDFDVIILVDDLTALLWLCDVKAYADDFDEEIYSESVAGFRRRSALEIIGLSTDDIFGLTTVQARKQDFFLFPENWRDMLEELQFLGRHRDPEFTRNIARDAVAFDPTTASFGTPMTEVK